MNQQPEALRLADLIPHLQAMGDELRRLHEENEALRKDAERYRHLRKFGNGRLIAKDFFFANAYFKANEELDVAIDDAMKSQS